MCLYYSCANERAKDGAFGWKVFEECDGRLYTPLMHEYIPEGEIVEDDSKDWLSYCDNDDNCYQTGFHIYDRREDMRKSLSEWRKYSKGGTKYIGCKVQYWDITATGETSFIDTIPNGRPEVIYFRVIVARKIVVCKDER